MRTSLLVVLLAGIPAIIYGAWAIACFKQIGRKIAVSQNRIEDYEQPGGEGFNSYEMALYYQLKLGEKLDDLPPDLAHQALHIGQHIKWSMRLLVLWVILSCLVYWIGAQ